ncbi:two-component sensor histidine kinase [Paenibacillus sp. LMG 31456]|uniref:histidine kinase n=1 Tax=Paenibacillus foliorum TaxID=2654974 RepID=A0A972H032_9BACL|nr:ATP-binding protein [Paenibacillus foliorum]NOU96090.1 two-component sensor histidine kinase [Paenibacillus foliorum]
MNIIHELLLNMLIILAPVMMYHLFWVDRIDKYQKVVNVGIITVLCTCASLLSLMISMELLPGYFYDLRAVPLAICLLYAGLRSALVVSAAIIAFRLYMGGSIYACLLAAIIITLTLVILSYCKPFVVSQHRTRNIAYATLAGFIIGLLASVLALAGLLWEGFAVSRRIIAFLGLYCVVHSITLGSAVYIIEQFKINLKLRKQIQHTDKMNTLSELAASFAHEIRNPMTVARGFMQFLKQPGTSEEKRQIYTQMVLDEIDKAQSIISNYLVFAKPHLESIELVDAKLLIQQALNSLKSYAVRCQVDLEIHLDDKLFISTNKDKFVQCITQLCKNGIEAMPAGGKLKVIGCIQANQVSINIIDHGIGMTNEEIRRLGTPFYSTRDRGTGLGMMITYKAIQTMKGKIDVTSEVGKGTCFSLLIPSLSSSSFH